MVLNKMDYNVWKIIYRYVFDGVVKSITQKVEPHYPNLVYKNVAAYDTRLISTKCSTCQRRVRPIDGIVDSFNKSGTLSWRRSRRKDNVCAFLVSCADEKTYITSVPQFISIINAVVYRAENRVYPLSKHEKVCLVPYFASDYCWQDLALKYIREKKCNEK